MKIGVVFVFATPLSGQRGWHSLENFSRCGVGKDNLGLHSPERDVTRVGVLRVFLKRRALNLERHSSNCYCPPRSSPVAQCESGSHEPDWRRRFSGPRGLRRVAR
jgi:hypothetical protein